MSSNKFALLCGLNYIGSNNELNGCINDVENMRKLLISKYKYQSRNIVTLTDKTRSKPTRLNILNALRKLLVNAGRIDGAQLYFHYSGHGTQLRDMLNKDEHDGKDECICALDGFIIDDEINQIIKQSPFLPSSRLIMVFDACHSGSMADLKYQCDCMSVRKKEKGDDNNDYDPNDWTYEYRMSIDGSDLGNKNKVFTISGCRDNQTSDDSYINGLYQGALTATFIHVLNQHENGKLGNILKDMYCLLKLGGHYQVPIIQSTESIDLDSYFTL